MKNGQKGFALAVSLLLLVVMTIMGLTLVSITSGDIRANNEKDYSQQTFYAAESGIAHAKKYLAAQKSLPTNSFRGSSYGTGQYSKLKYCTPDKFPNLSAPDFRVLMDDSNNFMHKRYNLSDVISASGQEKTRLSKFSFEYFITRTADKDGNTYEVIKKPGTNKNYYTIHSCGCDSPHSQCRDQNNKIVKLEAIVTLSNE